MRKRRVSADTVLCLKLADCVDHCLRNADATLLTCLEFAMLGPHESNNMQAIDQPTSCLAHVHSLGVLSGNYVLLAEHLSLRFKAPHLPYLKL